MPWLFLLSNMGNGGIKDDQSLADFFGGGRRKTSKENPFVAARISYYQIQIVTRSCSPKDV